MCVCGGGGGGLGGLGWERGCNRGVPLYTEVSSFQGVGIEGLHHNLTNCITSFLNTMWL